MDYGLDLLMNPKKVNRKKVSFNNTDTQDYIKEQLLKTDILEKPLTPKTLDTIINTTIELYEKRKRIGYLDPIERDITPPKLEKAKQIKINKIEEHMSIHKI